jgi:hypothetical protein
MHRRALLVGIDRYKHVSSLDGCVADAEEMATLLQQHEDGTPNYSCRLLLARRSEPKDVTRALLREACRDLFSDYKGDVLLYFSGHGALTESGGYLATSDAEQDDVGILMDEIMTLASKAKARDILILLDCCHSGDIGNPAILNSQTAGSPLALVRENLTIIAASRDSEAAIEQDGHGLFTSAVLDALRGGAADPIGWVTAPAIYAYVERRFGGWDQRPVYKSHTTGVTVIRECAPIIDRLKLRELVELFPTQDYKLQLDPEFEPEDEYGNMKAPIDREKLRIAHMLKEYRNASLVRPTTPGEQLFWTARYSHTVELTALGRQYWWLVRNKKV